VVTITLENSSTAYSAYIELSDDNPKPLSNIPVYLYDCNIHVYTNAIKYGNGTVIEGIAYAGETITFTKIKISDWFIKNKTAGLNADVAIVGTLPRADLKEALS
jgi:hypothetical protein